MSDLIYSATTVSDYAAFATLVTEYVEWSRKRYAADAWFVEQVFGHQSLASELLTLSSEHGQHICTEQLCRRAYRRGKAFAKTHY